MVILMVFCKSFLDPIKPINFLIGIKANSVHLVTEWNSFAPISAGYLFSLNKAII